jgi:polyphenol oxidase
MSVIPPVPYLSSDALEPLPHGFFGRQGGNSIGPFATNNMSVAIGDDADTVNRNRDRACQQLGFMRRQLVLLKQVHSNRVVALTERPDPERAMEADALVTRRRDLILGTLTADCTPVLLADHKAGVIGAVHAGWKGAANDIVYSTVLAMIGLGADPKNVRAAIGPTISAANYEVGPDFAQALVDQQPLAASRISKPEGGREHFDLPGFVADQLKGAGVGFVADCKTCTYAAPDAYFSHRYATHKGTTTGRQIALIGLA